MKTSTLIASILAMVSVALIVVAAMGKAAASEQEKPNIVFILTDDQGYGDLGCYGATGFATPNIDRLAKEGAKLTSFYVHNRCSPTRLALMTGCHAHRVGSSTVIYRREGVGIHPEEITVAELLKEAGYATGMVGKWHLGEHEIFSPIHHGFDRFVGFREYDDDRSTGLFSDKEILEEKVKKTDGIHSPTLLAAGIEFIRTHQDEPFFLYYASPLPHVKWLPNGRFSGSSEHGTYGDVIQEIDWQVGGLLDALDELGLSENTLVIYASDNGPQLSVEGHGSAGPLRDGKWTDFEGGIRVPCLMRWPDVIEAESVIHEITAVVDILPTLCAVAGVAVPTDRVIDGKNLLPYLEGRALDGPVRESFVVPGSAIRHGDWKLLVKAQKPGGKEAMWGERVPAAAGSLFNLKDDIGETTDVAQQYPDKVNELRLLFDAFMHELEAQLRPIGRIPDLD